MNNKNNPAIIPDKRVLPPALILTTVLMVARAPGIPPKKAAIQLPIPCPNNSLLGACFVLVKLSATTEVSRESMAPNKANVTAENKKGDISTRLKSYKMPKLKSGKPLGILLISRYDMFNK